MRARSIVVGLVLVGCTRAPAPVDSDTDVAFDPADPAAWDARFPAADAWSITGPGLGATTYTEAELWEHCAYLQGDPATTADHHNLVVMYDGWLILPWSPEDGGGGVSVFDVSDPCDPVKVGEGSSPLMRESHSLGFATIDGRTYMAVDYIAPLRPECEGDDPPSGCARGGGVGFWDLTDPTAPVWAGQAEVPGHRYPDSYTYLTLSVFWQGDHVFAPTAANGIGVFDASDPRAPVFLDAFNVPPHLVGTFHVWGNRGLASSAGLAKTVVWDVGDPRVPQPIPGGTFDTTDGGDRPVGYYFANLGADYALFARKDDNGGPILYDIADPSAPAFVGHLVQEDGDGGYIFQHHQYLMQGESEYGAVYDITDPTAPVEVGRVQLRGDLDTVTPLGHLLVAAVDSGATAGEASAIIPWQTAPDVQPPRAGMRSPVDGEEAVPVTGRVGVVFDEMIEPVSAHAGSVRLVTDAGEPVDAMLQVQENIVNLSPRAPLAPGTTYHVQLAPGGLADISGNALDAPVQWSFTTAAE